ncbi:MBL fold metallo-hydrolase [Hydrogenimonas sp.]
MPSLTITFDNVPFDPGLTNLWGFSAFIETPETRLIFDTGSNGRVLLKNMARLGLSPLDAEALVISHPHWDHIGGLDSVLEVNPSLHLFVPDSLSRHLIHDLRNLSGGVTVVGEAPEALMPGFLSIGVMGEIGEQSLVIDAGERLVVVTGCAHPGIVAIAERAMEMTGKPVGLLVGGFHLLQSPEETIVSVAEALTALGVERVCPTHCSGERAMAIFAETFGPRYIRGGAGRRLTW